MCARTNAVKCDGRITYRHVHNPTYAAHRRRAPSCTCKVTRMRRCEGHVLCARRRRRNGGANGARHDTRATMLMMSSFTAPTPIDNNDDVAVWCAQRHKTQTTGRRRHASNNDSIFN